MSTLLPIPAALDWLGTSLLASSVLMGIILLIRQPVARWFGPSAAYALWLLPIGRLFLPPLPFAAATLLAARPVVTQVPSIIGHTVDTVASAPVVAAHSASVDLLAILPAALPAVLIAIWLIGAVIQLARLVRHGWHWRCIIQQARVTTRIGRITVAQSDAIDGPLAIGLLRPFVLLPAADRLDFDAVEADLAVDHELNHHRRGDLWANALFAIAAALLWFHPLLRRALRAFRFDQEAACDATMLAQKPGARAAYARTLVKAATGQSHLFANPAPTMTPLLASPMVGSDRIKERLLMISRPVPSANRRRVGMCLAFALLATGSLLTATPARLHAQSTAATSAATPAPPAPPPAPAAPPLADRTAVADDHVTRIDRDGMTIVLHTDHPLNQADIERLVVEAQAPHTATDTDRSTADDQRQVRTIIIRRHADAAEAEATTIAAPAAAQSAAPIIANRQQIVIRSNSSGADAQVMMVSTSCNAGHAVVDVNESANVGNNHSQIRILNCVSGTVTPALQIAALRAARAQLASADSPMAANIGDARTQALASVDAQIAALVQQAQ